MKQDLVDKFTQVLKSESKSMEYIQARLRSASDIYKQGGHVTMVYKDQQFRMHFDNRRLIVAPKTESDSTNKPSLNSLLDSKPLKNITQGKNLRFMAKLNKTKLYSNYTSKGNKGKSYKKHVDLAVLNFLKGLLTEPPMFNLNREGLESYTKIVSYLKEFDSKIGVTEHDVANLKGRLVN